MTKNQEDDFYSEMDKKNFHRSCCNCQTMAILFGLILILAVGLSVYAVNRIKQINISLHFKNPNSELKKSFEDKISNDTNKNPETQIVITSEELTAMADTGFSGSGFTIKNISFEITQEEVDVLGKLIKPIGSDMKISTQPKVVDNKIKLEIKKITAGKLSLPKFVGNSLEKSLNNFMDESFKDFYQNYKVDNIQLQNDQITINGSLK